MCKVMMYSEPKRVKKSIFESKQLGCFIMVITSDFPLVIMFPMHILNFLSGDRIIRVRELKWYKAETKKGKKKREQERKN